MAACPREDGPLLSEAKLQSIMSFLDEMEKSGQGPPASAPQVWRGLQGPVPEEGLGRLEPASEVSTSVMRLQLEVEEKKQAMVLLQRALVTSPPALPPSPCPQLEQVPGRPLRASSLSHLPHPPQAQQRDLTIRRVKETEKELGRQLRQQKEHYEATIQRHLSFIDQVVLPGRRGLRAGLSGPEQSGKRTGLGSRPARASWRFLEPLASPVGLLLLL